MQRIIFPLEIQQERQIRMNSFSHYEEKEGEVAEVPSMTLKANEILKYIHIYAYICMK